jgi:hypothetical protein
VNRYLSPGEIDVTDDTREVEAALEQTFADILGVPVTRRLEWVASDDGKHTWLGASETGTIGMHVDDNGVWIDLRSPGTKSYPELALCVPKDGGSAKLQVSNGTDMPILLDLLEVAQGIQRVLDSQKLA